jgi:DNA-binding GntR family transcriptional regulator
MASTPTRTALRAAILGGEYLPGERLVEAQLSTRFRASRFAVRAALRDLAGEGLVVAEPHRGAHVRKVSLAEAIEITEVRMVVEGLVAARAAANATDQDAADRDEVGREMRAAVENGAFRRYSDLNQRLHALIGQIAGHRTAEQLIGTLRGQLVRHQFMLSLLPGRPERSLPQHEHIIEAIRSRDSTAAESAMRTHISSVVEALRQLEPPA